MKKGRTLLIGVLCLILGYFVGHFRGSGALIEWMYSADAEKADAYYEALGAVQKDAQLLSEFRQIFPEAVERVRYFAPGREPGFDVEVHLHERYVLTMQLPVMFDVSGTRVVGYGTPAFYLNEVERVEKTPSDTVAISYDTAGALRFGPAEWRKLFTHGGDFSSIGYKMITDRPVPNFSLYTITK